MTKGGLPLVTAVQALKYFVDITEAEDTDSGNLHNLIAGRKSL